MLSNLVAGTYYLIKIAAVNKYGVGQMSSSLTVVAGQKPDPAVVGPLVTLDGSYVQIIWTAANSNYVTVDQYMITVRGTDSSYHQQLANCDGSNQLVVG